jgi:hypothetical protein
MSRFGKHKWWILTVALTLPAIAIAAIPYQTFTAGTVISASQLQADFQNIESRLSALEGKAPSAVVKVIGPQVTVAPGAWQWSTVNCPSGYIASGVSCADNTQSTPPMILNTAAVSSTITDTPQVGNCAFYNSNTTVSQKFTAYVTCVALH